MIFKLENGTDVRRISAISEQRHLKKHPTSLLQTKGTINILHGFSLFLSTCTYDVTFSGI